MAPDLSDVQWGDVVSDDDGVLVVRGSLDGRPVVTRRYGPQAPRREIAHHALLHRLGVPVPTVVASGDEWLLLDDVVAAGFRPLTVADLDRDYIATALAGWYATLHRAGSEHLTGVASATPEDARFDNGVSDGLREFVTPAALDEVASQWPGLRPAMESWRGRLADLFQAVEDADQTLALEGFGVDRFVVDDLTGEVLPLDLTTLGRGVRSADVRDVCSMLGVRAARAFGETYSRNAGPLDPREASAWAALQHLASLVLRAWVGEAQPPEQAVAELEGLARSQHLPG